MATSRRSFLRRASVAGAALGLGDLAFIDRLPRVSAAESTPNGDVVRLQPDIEPLVRLLEETPRERLLEEMAGRIRSGASYREVLAALMLAGVRNIQPRPEVGFKFHAVLVVNSAHVASLSSPDAHRWLPIFWALDHFKEAQQQDVREGNWTMRPVDETALPPADKARTAFIEAMDRWDVAKADAAVASLARHSSLDEVYELMFRFGARDFRSIGHKAIYVANSRRTLETIGWQHAEPVLRSLAYAILKHEGDNPADRDAPADRPGRANQKRASELRADWTAGRLDEAATREMLATLRTAGPDDACAAAVAMVNRGVSPQSVWDALLVGAGELLVRQPGIVALHAVTTTNALYYAWQMAAEDSTRRMMLLQNAAFLPMFREAMQGRGQVQSFELDKLEPAELAGDAPATGQILADVSRDNHSAARKLLGHLSAGGSAKELIDAARLMVFLKGNNAHDYKFSSAVLEDYHNVSPAWRNRYLASSVFSLRGSSLKDNALVARTRAALGAA